MKTLKWIGHPVLFVIIYLLLIIEGDHFGGFFILYLLLTLPHLVPYAVVSAFGIIGVVIGYNIEKEKQLKLKLMCYFIGFCLMILALILFFAKGNKWETFNYILPTVIFIIFGICGLCFLLNAIRLLQMNNDLRK
jgi:hypothetical protein